MHHSIRVYSTIDYRLSSVHRMTERQRCGLCNEVTDGASLLLYEGICFYCYLDTSTDSQAEYIRQKLESGVIDCSSPSPVRGRAKIIAEQATRRTKRVALW